MSGSIGTIETPASLQSEQPDNTSQLIAPVNIRNLSESAFAIITGSVKGANYTAALTDRGVVIPFNTNTGNTASNATYTIPTHASVAFANGVVLGFLWVNGASIQPAIAGAGGVTIVSPTATQTARTQGSICYAFQYSQDVWYLFGDYT